MGRALLVLLAPLVFTAPAVAQTQVTATNTPEAVLARMSPGEVVSRLLSFDRNHDGRIAKSELAERMQPMLARADTNRDGALDRAEIRAIVSVPPQPMVVRPGLDAGEGFHFGRSYGFADDTSFSSRNHIEGAIEDLKLAADKKQRALAIAKAYVDGIEAEAEADLMKDLSGIATPAQLLALHETLEAYPLAVLTIRSKDGTVVRETVARAVNIQPHINQLRLTPDRRPFAQAAADHYAARLKIGEAERIALVDRLHGVLSYDECADLRAALVRRPVTATGGVLALTRLLDAVKRERLSQGIEGTVSLEVNSPQER